jgi:hypothetical protein
VWCSLRCAWVYQRGFVEFCATRSKPDSATAVQRKSALMAAQITAPPLLAIIALIKKDQTMAQDKAR